MENLGFTLIVRWHCSYINIHIMAMEYPFTYHSESWSSSHVLVQLIDLMEISSPCCATWCLAHQTSSTSSCSSEKAVTPCSLDTSREVSGGVSRGGVLELVDMKNIERLVINVRAALDSPFWQPRQGRENCIFETLYNEKRCVLSVKESNINEKNQNFHICLRSGPRGLTPPPPWLQSAWLQNLLFYASSKQQ